MKLFSPRLRSDGRCEDEGRRRDESTTGRRTIERRVRASSRVEILPSRGLSKERERERKSVVGEPPRLSPSFESFVRFSILPKSIVCTAQLPVFLSRTRFFLQTQLCLFTFLYIYIYALSLSSSKLYQNNICISVQLNITNI